MKPSAPAFFEQRFKFFDALTCPAMWLTLIGAIVLLGLAMNYTERPLLRRLFGVLLGATIAALAAALALDFLLFTSSWTY